jgi:hypothetical protein
MQCFIGTHLGNTLVVDVPLLDLMLACVYIRISFCITIYHSYITLYFKKHMHRIHLIHSQIPFASLLLVLMSS